MFDLCSSPRASVVEEARLWAQAELSQPAPGRPAMADPGVRKEGAENPRVLGVQVRHIFHKYPSPRGLVTFRNLLLRGKGNVSLTSALAMGQTPQNVTRLLESQGSI